MPNGRQESRLGAIADLLLQAVVEAFAVRETPPAVAYVADGNLTFDFGNESAIVVVWDGITPGLPGGGGVSSFIQDGYMLTANFSIYVLQPAPQPDDAGNPPQPDEMYEAAAALLADAYVALEAVVNGFAAAQLGGLCTQAAIIRQVPVGPDGGVEGSRLYVGVQL
jgi:hypothetical protein